MQCITRIHHVKLRVRDLSGARRSTRSCSGCRCCPRLRGGTFASACPGNLRGAEFGIVLSQWSQQEIAPARWTISVFEVPSYDERRLPVSPGRSVGAQPTVPRFYERHWQTFYSSIPTGTNSRS